MDKIKKVILFRIPMSICNFRCSYCYIGQKKNSFQGVQPEMKYTPEQVARACSVERLGGKAYMNFCANGETLLTKDIDKYVKALVEQGHYAEVVTNLTVTSMLDKFLLWDKDLLKRLEFKCSFHYLELKKKGWLELFAENVKKIWEAGASANIEITPSDELIPYLDEVKEFSIKHFGALPHLSIARDDRTKEIDYLTNLSLEEYDAIWSTFDSGFWKYKKTIFGKKQTEFCYAGLWSAYVDLTTGDATACYCGGYIGNAFAEPEKCFPEKPIGKCNIAHCYNGHMLLTLGLIPNATDVRYGNIRNRVMENGSQWLQPELLNFFNSTCVESNNEWSNIKKKKYLMLEPIRKCKSVPKRAINKLNRIIAEKK